MIAKPIVLEAQSSPRVWGGERLSQEFGRPDAGEPVGESWEVHGALKVSGTDLTLDDLVAEHGVELLGRKAESSGTFPLLAKWLDCCDWLSVQVHPDDALAREYTGDSEARGKTEAWYVYRCSPEAEFIHGLATNADLQQLRDLRGADILPFLNRQHPEEGQLYFTPAGQIHALGPGSLLYEVQQSCDLTYRLYDWGRDRPIDFEQSFDCALRAQPNAGQVTTDRLSCSYFFIELLKRTQTWQLDGRSFEILVATQPNLELAWKNGSMPLACGQTVVLPANLGEVSLRGEVTEPVLRIGIE